MTEVSTTVGAVAPGAFSAGRVLGRAFGLLMRRFWSFFFLALITGVPFLAAATLIPAEGHRDHTLGALSGLLQFLLYTLSQAVILYAAVQEMRGRPFRIAESFCRGLARLLPIIGLVISLSIMLGVGLVLLVVPLLIFLAMFYVALPVCVIERLGPIRSMGRSAELTKGYRWQVFGIVLVLVVGSLLVEMPIIVVVAILGYPALLPAVSGLVNVLINAYQSVVVAVAYHDLRAVREGTDIDGIAAVFD